MQNNFLFQLKGVSLGVLLVIGQLCRFSCSDVGNWTDLGRLKNRAGRGVHCSHGENRRHHSTVDAKDSEKVIRNAT